MRTQLFLSASLLLGVLSTGCFKFIEEFPDGTGGGTGNGGAGGTTNTGGAGGAGGGTTTTTEPPKLECIPSQPGATLVAECGGFVSPAGDDVAGKGTPASPFATITRALKDHEYVYACADPANPYEEAVSIDKPGVFIYGGLNCETWTLDADAKTALTAKPGEIPLTVRASSSVHIEDFAITAQDAPPLQNGVFATGNSSIAILSGPGSVLELTRCDVTAGKGGDGATGEAAPDQQPGVPGEKGADGCDNPDGTLGGKAGQNMCDSNNLGGGNGGPGTTDTAGGDGSDGKPAGLTGKGGLGQGDGITCSNGAAGLGKEGTTGAVGPGATESMLGTITDQGFIGARGTDGVTGTFGQGGGGGGGAPKCTSNNNAGPGGGGGGAGGCGGIGGKGGYAGGASIGILFLGADPATDLVLSVVSIRTADGGVGGLGALGQIGGAGGAGGMPGMGEASSNACPGGAGGKGGNGGKGGAGRGGHSIGVAHTSSTELKLDESVTVTLGAFGAGGTDMDFPAADGADGVAEPTQSFK